MRIIVFRCAIVVAALTRCDATAFSEAEPYPDLNDGSFTGPPVAASPDPLVRYRWNAGVNETLLQVYYLQPLTVTTDEPASFAGLQSLATANPNVTVLGTGNIVLDFGVESAAWLEIYSDDLGSPASITMSISEYNQPEIVNSGPANPVKTLQPTQYGNMYRLELNSELYEGVRFGFIHVNSFQQVWHITGVRLVCQIKPTNYTGSFDSDDETLTRVWWTAAYTVKLNLMSNYLGSILIDRGDRFSWTGDAHTSQACALVAFSNYAFIKENLDRTAQDDNGGIQSYAIYWIFSLLDYYRYTGDNATLVGYIPLVQKKLDNGLSLYGTNPSLEFFGDDERIGTCFEDPSCPESERAYNMLVLRACFEFADVMQSIGRADLFEQYNTAAAALVAALRSEPLWYADYGMHAMADAVNAGFTTSVEQESMFPLQFDAPLEITSFSPFNTYFVIRALARMRRLDIAVDAVKQLWGGMLNLGATTFWEVFSPQWELFMQPTDPVPNGQTGYTSMCHPWAAGVAMWLTENVLGIRPLAAGFRLAEIVPHLPVGSARVRGSVSTPLGEIEASFDFSSGLHHVVLPSGCVAYVGVPLRGGKLRKLTVNGVQLPTRIDEDRAYFRLTAAGRHDIVVDFVGREPVVADAVQPTPRLRSAAENYTYNAVFVKEDNTTQGNWTGVYGALGYYLFSFKGSGNDASQLPSFIQGVSWQLSGAGTPQPGQWAAVTADVRAPQNPVNASGARAAGYMATQNPIACQQTFRIDVNLTSPRWFQTALYFVDWDAQQRSQVLEVFDLETKNIVAPFREIADFTGGRYLVYAYNASVRFRVAFRRGGDAVVTGLFFDDYTNAV